MSSVKVMLVVSLFIPAVRPSSDLWKLECLPTVGIFAQTTIIRCFFKNIKDINIVAVSLTKAEENEAFFTQEDLIRSGDPRFSLENLAVGPSLQISNTKFSDEGKYMYCIVTDYGFKEIQLSISVTAKYKDPVTSTWPEYVTNGGPVSLYCNATDGYPEGFIHWFDRSGTNWTINSELIKKAPKDISGVKSVALSSKLAFKSINSDLAPFRCIVFNSKYVQDGENTLEITSAIHDSIEDFSGSNKVYIASGVIAIGSLIVGLLLTLLFFRKRNSLRYESGHAAEDDLETGDIHLEPQRSKEADADLQCYTSTEVNVFEGGPDKT